MQTAELMRVLWLNIFSYQVPRHIHNIECEIFFFFFFFDCAILRIISAGCFIAVQLFAPVGHAGICIIKFLLVLFVSSIHFGSSKCHYYLRLVCKEFRILISIKLNC
ncbi:unnamed protein product [Coffea canephora]|uniref:Uncharacterized protein n=1 Tax=Coffea canephora TaxID=49390 RepID=A0A068TNE7_COFCA|nr:unnamed protein product [Coffea canephora]